MNPRLVVAAASTHLGYDHETIRIGMEGLLDDLIGDMRAVKVTGVDMVHANPNCLSQNGNRSVHVARRSPHLRTG
jgi:hypothetical protein